MAKNVHFTWSETQQPDREIQIQTVPADCLTRLKGKVDRLLQLMKEGGDRLVGEPVRQQLYKIVRNSELS
eukprot:432405-Amphidinium_carterae.1